MVFTPLNAQGQEPSAEVTTQSAAATITDQSGVNILSSLPFHFSLGVHGGYDDNFGTTASRNSSFFTTGTGNISYDLYREQTQIDLRTGGALTYFYDQTSAQNSNVDAFVDLSVVHDVSARLKLTATVDATYRTEPDFSSDVGPNSRQGNYFDTSDSVSAAYNWTMRFSTVTSDKFRAVDYPNSSVGATTNRIDNTFGQQFRFNLLSATTAFVGEYRFEAIDYQSFSVRNSTTHYALAGIDDDFNPELKLTVRGGATFRSYTDDGSRIDPHFESSLTYAGAHNSTLSWTTSYGLEEPNASSLLSRTTFRTGLEFKYDLTARISSTFSGYYHHDQDEGLAGVAGFSEDAFDLSLDCRYAINRRFAFDLGIEHSEIDSGVAARDYSRNRYFTGLTFTY